MADTLQQQANAIATQYGIPYSLFNSLIANESSWNPNAQANGSTAFGLTQLTAPTALAMGVTNINDPVQQLQGGAKYLSSLYNQFGNWNDALAAYNQGPANYQSADGQAYAKKIYMDSLDANNVMPSAPTKNSANVNNLKAGTGGLFNEITGWVNSKISSFGFIALGIGFIFLTLIFYKPQQTIITKAKDFVK